MAVPSESELLRGLQVLEDRICSLVIFRAAVTGIDGLRQRWMSKLEVGL